MASGGGAGGEGGEGPCLPECYCDRCLPQRLLDFEALPPSQQRAFWSHVTEAGGQHLHRLFPAPPPPIPTGELPESLSTSTRARARWDMPHHVLENVPNISDAFEFIDNHLETHAGPHRKQCMREAMQKVIDIYADLFRPNPSTTIENVENPVIISIDNAQVGEFEQRSDAEAQLCVICTSEFENGEQYVLLDCSHIFHKECLDGLIHHTWRQNLPKFMCPNCRGQFFVNFQPRN
ncbi:hypothetical protein GOP47_0015328 [Adiantum capillus-veneris]|uniref:RING-type domain-containing protein n=1 Tax=Adiantum capillus-veneris TaxID=13818 RepID=A0A9D4UK78_ADICA|nr:hypothetical protein GOP47_0015328 [Adiantum capillus-veneris]